MSEEKKDIEGQLVMEQVEQKKNEIVEQPQQTAISLFGTTDPVKTIEKAVVIADAVKAIIAKKNLYTIINSKAYVHCEGWTTMGSLLGVFPQIEKTVDLSDEQNGIKRYLAFCTVKTLNGLTLSKAESECSNQENKGKKGDKGKWENYALRSMAQTRAISKTLRLPLGWIMKLAGYETTPYEEIDEYNMVNVTPEIKDGNGNIDKGLTELNTLFPKTEGETIKVNTIKKIRYLMEKLNMDEPYLMGNVYDGEPLAKLNESQLTQIMMVLKRKHYDGVTIKKVTFNS